MTREEAINVIIDTYSKRAKLSKRERKIYEHGLTDGIQFERQDIIDQATRWIIDNFPTNCGITALMYAEDFCKTLEKIEFMLKEREVYKFSYDALRNTPIIENYAHAFRQGFKIGADWAYNTTIEKVVEWLKENASNFVMLADEEHPAIGDTKAFYSMKSLIHCFRQEMEGE